MTSPYFSSNLKAGDSLRPQRNKWTVSYLIRRMDVYSSHVSPHIIRGNLINTARNSWIQRFIFVRRGKGEFFDGAWGSFSNKWEKEFEWNGTKRWKQSHWWRWETIVAIHGWLHWIITCDDLNCPRGGTVIVPEPRAPGCNFFVRKILPQNLIKVVCKFPITWAYFIGWKVHLLIASSSYKIPMACNDNGRKTRCAVFLAL